MNASDRTGTSVKRASTVGGHCPVKSPHLKWSREMMRVENSSTQKLTARQESNCSLAGIFFQNGLVVAAGIAPTFQCRQHQITPGKSILVAVLLVERVCVQFRGAQKINYLCRFSDDLSNQYCYKNSCQPTFLLCSLLIRQSETNSYAVGLTVPNFWG
ncbi:TPA: hypothetical protein MPK85_005356 [Salmonella enterica]|nr:hypothetical protein [Salmonella enterica]